MNFPVLNNQWNPVGGLFNLPNNMLERASSIGTGVALAATAARVGLWAARMGLSGLGQVCPEHLPCQEPAVSRRETSLVDPANPPFGWEADPSKRETALVDLKSPPFGWEADLKRETALVDLAKPPVGWESPTQLCNPQPQTNFCKAFYAGVHFSEEIISTISDHANSVLGNLYQLRTALNALVFVLNRIARRV